MLGNNRQRLELAFSLLFSLPGTPMMQYGDEIGMGDNLRLPERECARTPMQWTSEKHGGFSRARRIVRPAIDDPVYGYQKVNVADQRRDPQSLLNWTERVIRARKECPEISWGDFAVLRTNVPEVLAMRYDWRQTSMVTLHNFSNHEQKLRAAGRRRSRRNAGGSVRRAAQPPTRRWAAPHHARAVRLAVVPGGSTGQHPRSKRPFCRSPRCANRSGPGQIVNIACPVLLCLLISPT
jgi:hypothetical protein